MRSGMARQRMRLVQHRSSHIVSVQNQIWRSSAVRLDAATIRGKRSSVEWPTLPDDFASYCRLVDSKKTSNNKKKGEGNRKNGNPYLAWAFMEAAQFALRYLPAAKRFYERKRRQRHMVLAKKALAHKIARACYRMLREEVPFERERLFAA